MMIIFCVVLMDIVMTLMIVIVVGRHGEAKDLYNLTTCCPHWIEKVTCQRHYCLPLFACSVECHFWTCGIQMEAILKLHIANPTTMSKRWTKTLPNLQRTGRSRQSKVWYHSSSFLSEQSGQFDCPLLTELQRFCEKTAGS